jgi:hypothetical protein
VRRTSMSWARPVAVLLAVLIAVAGGAPPAAAEPVKSYPAATRLSSTIAATVGSLKPTARAVVQATPDAGTADSPRSFFRTPTGVAAIVLMVGGAAYVAYKIPKDNGKVHSPIR